MTAIASCIWRGGNVHIFVLGGTGNFGARIVRALHADATLQITAASRRATPVTGAEGVANMVLDYQSSDFAARLRTLQPELVIHCVGPFQGQDYRVARAALEAGAHYLDLSDAREFVVGFASALTPLAKTQGKVAISGASTLPALSSAVIDHLIESMQSIERIDIVIAPGQRAARGEATLAAVFSYLGAPLGIWRGGRWRRAWGWMDLRRITLDVGHRWGAACDVADLALLPERYRGVQTVNFHAALEFRAQHAALWFLAGMRRAGLPFPVERWAAGLNRAAAWFDPFAGPWGGMSVSVLGMTTRGNRVRRTWQLRAPAADGPEIPCMPAILLARQIARGQVAAAGAYACVGMTGLAEFAAEFSRWNIRTRMEESAA